MIKEMKLMNIEISDGEKNIVEQNAQGKVLKVLSTDLKNCLLGLDDASAYLTPQKDEFVQDMLVNLRHQGIDLIMSFHALADIPRFIYRMTNKFILFRTSEIWKDALVKIPTEMVPEVEKGYKLLQKGPNKHALKIFEFFPNRYSHDFHAIKDIWNGG